MRIKDREDWWEMRMEVERNEMEVVRKKMVKYKKGWS